jgi:hypothetical protein
MIKVSLPRASHAPNLVPHKAPIFVARIQKCQALRACMVWWVERRRSVCEHFDMGLPLIRIMNMTWRSLHHQQTLTTMALSALQLGGPFAQY